MSSVSYYDLGATLYTPCTHPNLYEVLQSGADLARSKVVCLEDAVHDDELGFALSHLKKTLKRISPDPEVQHFIRPRNPLILAEILEYADINKIDGFVLPKFDCHSSELYRKVIEEHQGQSFAYMPTLETAQVFDSAAMLELKQQLDDWESRIVCLRIGGNDLMNLLGIKRLRGLTIYDTPLRAVIDQLVINFRLSGIELSSPVFDIIDDIDTLRREVMLDLAYGFYAKTAIHPKQVNIIEHAYSEYSDLYAHQAERVLNAQSPAVFQCNGQMMETSCHKNWAVRAKQLANRFNQY